MNISPEIYQRYLADLLKGDRAACYSRVRSLLEADIDLKELYVDLFQRSLYEVGGLWERNLISVSAEHLATAMTESLLSLAYPRLFNTERKGRKAVVSCVSNEYHQIGGKMVADTLELQGWDGYFLGADTPLRDLIEMVDEKKPDLVGLSLAVFMSMSKLMEALEALRAEFPGLDIIVGGQAFRWGGVAAVEAYPNVHYIASIFDLEARIATY
ncbi:MAG: cobalamin-dependent protein [Pseudomonadota bacterium]